MSPPRFAMLLFVFLFNPGIVFGNELASKPKEINYDLKYMHSTAGNFFGNLQLVLHNNLQLTRKTIYQGRDGFDTFIYQVRKHGTVEKVRKRPIYTARDCLLMGLCGPED